MKKMWHKISVHTNRFVKDLGDISENKLKQNMMKKIIATLVLVLTVSISFAQQKSKAEKMATQNTKEMVKVLSLDADQEASIYAINVEKNQKLIDNNKKEQPKDAKKANQKEIYVEAGRQFKELLGLDTMKVWWEFKKQQAANKKA